MTFSQITLSADAVQDGVLTAVSHNGRLLFVTRYEGKPYAFTSLCPHAGASFDADSLHRWKLTCPDHDYCFDIRSGRILWPEDEMVRLKRYQVSEADGQLVVQVD